tara:strand:- start:41 stop:742 length:702 start_codon:yes stop_codon:yes gene_type:complete
MKPICIIPARKGSKRIKNKNIKLFAGKPLISYVIKIAKKSKLFSRIIVSTDSKKIANIAKSNGAEVPFVREKKLSNDYVGVAAVLTDCIQKISSEKVKYHFCIFPTAPLINYKDLIKAYNIIKKKRLDYLIAMSNYNVSPFHACKIKKNNIVTFYWPKYAAKSSRNLPSLVHDVGAFYIYKTKSLITSKSKILKNLHLSKKKTAHYLLDKSKSVDINTIEDFKFAEFLYKFRN